ncbi:MAG: hypothetical protein ABR562_00220 [Thermoplasmatota archaeon]
MPDEILVALTGLFGGAILTAAMLVGAFLLRRIHELRDRIRDVEARMDRLRPIEEILAKASMRGARTSSTGGVAVATEPDRREIFLLVARGVHDGRLSAEDESRLRRLMASHNPSSPRLDWDQLLYAGLVMTGAWLTFEPETVEA